MEVLENLLGEGPYFGPEFRREVVKLGIEALIETRDKAMTQSVEDWGVAMAQAILDAIKPENSALREANCSLFQAERLTQ